VARERPGWKHRPCAHVRETRGNCGSSVASCPELPPRRRDFTRTVKRERGGRIKRRRGQEGQKRRESGSRGEHKKARDACATSRGKERRGARPRSWVLARGTARPTIETGSEPRPGTYRFPAGTGSRLRVGGAHCRTAHLLQKQRPIGRASDPKKENAESLRSPVIAAQKKSAQPVPPRHKNEASQASSAGTGSARRCGRG